jgi:hypothetical protein
MNPAKRLGLVVALVVAVGRLGSTTAWAAETYVLANTGVEPGASGTVTYSGDYVTVKCKGLRPLSPYVVVYLTWNTSSFQDIFVEWEDYERQFVKTDKKGCLTIKVPFQSSYRLPYGSRSTTRWFERVENDADPPQVVLY